MKRVPEVVSHFVHELSPPSHEHSESLPEGQALLQAPPDGGGSECSELNESFSPVNERIRFWARRAFGWVASRRADLHTRVKERFYATSIETENIRIIR